MVHLTPQRLASLVPYGLVTTRDWLKQQGLERHRLDNALKSHQLVACAPGVYQRPDAKITWQGALCSLQRMGLDVYPGGLTALELQGLGHYLPLSEQKIVHVYGTDKLPDWLGKTLPQVNFVWHSHRQLFGKSTLLQTSSHSKEPQAHGHKALQAFTKQMPWGLDEWPLLVSSAERALFEVLMGVPQSVSFEHADQLMQGLANLSPKRLNQLLDLCHHVKVRRLFLWFAERHKHAWWKKIEQERFNIASGALGSGKRVIAKDGKLDSRYLITVPEGMHG